MGSASNEQLVLNQYLSISNLKEDPRGSVGNHLGFRKKNFNSKGLLHSRSKDEMNFFSNTISPFTDQQDPSDLYGKNKKGFLTQRLNQDFKKHQKSSSLAESDLHNLYSANLKSSSKND